MAKHGFSLIELLIALTLGLLVILTTVALFSASTRTLRASHRISVQNQLLLTGIWQGLDDLDTWAELNDPGAPTDNNRLPRLRKATPNATATADALPFNDWRPGLDSRTFLPDSPRWWYRWRFIASLADHGIAQDSESQLPVFTLFGHSNFTSTESYAADPVQDATDRRFLHELQDRLATRLGFYALFDYLPPAMPIGVAQTKAPWAAPGSAFQPAQQVESSLWVWEPKWLYHGDKILQQATSDGALTRSNRAGEPMWDAHYPADGQLGGGTMGGNILAVVGRDFGDSDPDRFQETTRYRNAQRRVFSPYFNNIDTSAKAANYRLLFQSCLPGRRLIPVLTPGQAGYSPNGDPPPGPPGWPDLSITTRHLLMRGVFLDHVVVRLDDPLTGEALGVTLSAVTTSLRGARINRGLDSYP